MFHRYFLVFVLILIIPLFTQAASRKVALVIGNANYIHSPLTNPINDANDISQMLTRLGFDVILGIDLNRKQLRKKIREFGKKLHHSDMGFFYYAGHGVQTLGENYLIPLQAEIMSEAEIPDEAISANAVLRQMERAENKVNIVILDACRNNPFASSFRSKNRGLVGMYGPVGSYIAYATSPGKTAADGNGRNGLYTQYLLKYMKNTDLGIEQVLKKVRIAVSEASNGQQIPWENSSLMGNFYFNIDGVFEQNKSVIEGVGYLSETDEKFNFNGFLVKQTYIIYTSLTIIILILSFLFYKIQRQGQIQKTNHLHQLKHIKSKPPSTQNLLHKILAVGQVLRAQDKHFMCDILPLQPITFGRDALATINLNRVEASRFHGQIGWDEKLEQFWIEDLNSKNGIFIANTEEIYQRIPCSQRIPIKTDQAFYFIDDKSSYLIIKNQLISAAETVSVDINEIATDNLLTAKNTKPAATNQSLEIKCYIKKHNKDNTGIEEIVANITTTSRIIIGRDNTADITIDQKNISRQHSLIYWDEKMQKCMIKDLGSANGTWTSTNIRIPENKSIPLLNNSSFYLANEPENSFIVRYL